MQLYIDVDGVILGRGSSTGNTVLARHATEFLRFALSVGPTYWLSSWCRGIDCHVMEQLKLYADPAFLDVARHVRSAHWDRHKTERLSGDFLWLDDGPSLTDLEWLEDRGWRDRWIEVNTRARPDDLVRAETVIRERVRP